MTDEDNSEEVEGDTDLLRTFIGILTSEDVVTLRDRAFEFIRRGRDAALSFVSEDEEKIRYNLDVLEDPEAEIRLVEKGPDEPPLRKIELEDDEIIELNLTVLNEDEQAKVVSMIEDSFEQQGRLLTHEQELGYNVADGARDDPTIGEILDFFDFFSDRDKQLLRRGLSIRKAWEDDSIYIERDQMEEWKNDLEQEFGEHGSTVANFCSSGYYDPDGVIPWIMDRVIDQYEDDDKILSLYYDILDNEPFVVYVGGYDNPWPISVELKEKLDQYDSYPYEIPFVELRAQGYRNMSVAEQAIEHLSDEIPDSAIKTNHSEIEFVFRINPEIVEDSAE